MVDGDETSQSHSAMGVTVIGKQAAVLMFCLSVSVDRHSVIEYYIAVGIT